MEQAVSANSSSIDVASHDEFQRGVRAAAHVAEMYDGSSTHQYRLGDCILGKLNVGNRKKPRRNRRAIRQPGDTWILGFATALAEMHRRLVHGNDSTSVCAVARAAGITLKLASGAGVSAFDLKELKRAGIAAR